MYRALIVCNSRFPQDPGVLAGLNGPKADGVLLRDALTDADTGLFDRSEVTLLPEADSPEILGAAEDFFGDAEADDVLLFYYSGHGRSLSQELFLCAGNTRANRLESSAVASSALSRMITRSFAQVKIVLLDCCYGGGFKGGDLTQGLSGKGRFVIAAASVTELASDAETRGEPSPFTKALAEGLLGEARDSEGKGTIHLDDLFAHVSGIRFQGHAPQRKFDGAGAVPIGRRARKTEPSAPPSSAGADVTPPNGAPAPETAPSAARRSAPARSGADLLESVVPRAALDHARIQSFRNELRRDVAAAYPPQLTTHEFLVRSGLVQEGGPTLAGALLFGENPTAVLPTAMVRCVRFRGTDKTDPATTTELHGTIPELIVQSRDFVAATELLGELPTTEAAHTEAVYRFPMIAVREIIANAVVHRDYARRDACVAVHVYDDRVEVISPGAWSGGDHPVPDGQQRLAALERQSQPRNFRLARVLSWAKLVESVGAGLPRSVADCRTMGAPEPVVRIRHGMVTVTVFPLTEHTPEPPRPPHRTAGHAERRDEAHGIDPARIAQISGENSVGGPALGTGYRVTNDIVLTARHIVLGKNTFRIRFPAGPTVWEATAEVVLFDEGLDVAVLRFSPPGEADVVAPVRFGRVSQRPTVLPVETVGFPAFKRRPGRDPSQRDLALVQGTTSGLTNINSGTLSIRTTEAPTADGHMAGSPWSGMSGAPVWADGLLVGIVNTHLRAEGPGTLGATRIDRFLSGAESELTGLLGLPVPLDLPEVPAPEVRSVAPYLAHVREIAPARLLDREAELAALADFCGGERTYAVLRGQPWAGKTALASWFALHPPENADVVSFFASARLVGQSDGTAFAEALVEQLGWYLGQERARSPRHTGTLETRRHQLLATAARKAHQERRRLVLVVDGIDEDTGPSAGLPSIASLLPANPPTGLRVMVTGRRLPLPDDVPERHPLRHCPEDLLAPAPAFDAAAARAANAELLALLSVSETQRDVLGLISVADGLPLNQLAHLVELAPYELARLLQGPLGRLLAVSDADGPATGTVRFALSSLRKHVMRMLGSQLVRTFEKRIDPLHSGLGPYDDPWATPPA
ncbi:caspase family protein [Streptomyces sp. NPDC020141]|uniref:caspase family protein n=1 Tax=Streptomyces sp. NPDC020141 TaxID=3365065 RepID=UPI0037A9EA53